MCAMAIVSSGCYCLTMFHVSFVWTSLTAEFGHAGQPPQYSICRSSGHRAPACPLSGLCRRCRQPGHMARECTQAWGSSVSAPATDMPSEPSASSDHVTVDASSAVPDSVPVCSASVFNPAAPVFVTVTAPVTVPTAPVSVAAPVPVFAAPASVDAAPTTVPAVAASAPAASQVPAVPSTNTDLVPLPQFSCDPEIVEKKLRGYVKKLVTNQVKGVAVATLGFGQRKVLIIVLIGSLRTLVFLNVLRFK